MISGRNELIMLPCSAPIGILLSKLKIFRRHFSTFVLTRGLLTALLNSAFIYLDYWNFSLLWLNTIVGIVALYLLLPSNKTTWGVTGFFTGIFWFWWIALSFNHYHLPWAIPFVILAMGLLYGVIFWSIATMADRLQTLCPTSLYPLPSLILKALGLLTLSYLHPFGFDWFKPELLFVESWFGITKWHFALILTSLVLTLWRREPYYLPILLFAYAPLSTTAPLPSPDIEVVTMRIPVEEKWDPALHDRQFRTIFEAIDHAIDTNKSLVVLPESVFPLFLNRSSSLLHALKERSQQISIVTGGLYWEDQTPRNSTYIFTNGTLKIANKVILVPFGERNPLPDFLSKWVNRHFYGGAVDYRADTRVTDYTIDGERYRNAICFEATSERLYEGMPQKMIVLSNNGWFTPSIEPTLQKLLLQYYSRKYGTTLYHAVNASPSYYISHGRVTPFL